MISKGNILISEPYLGDTNFERTVILICDHNAEGTFGFILNKPTNVIASTAIQGIDEFEGKLYIGGPVSQDSVHFIHRGDERIEGDVEILDQVYWGGNFDELKFMLKHKRIAPEKIRFFVGYSGWGAGQLDDEMDRKSWIVGSATSDEIFETQPSRFWSAILRNMGGKYKMLANYPIDPRLN